MIPDFRTYFRRKVQVVEQAGALVPEPRTRFTAEPQSALTEAELGDRARDAGDWAAAIPRYEAAVRRDPSLCAIWVQLGHAYKETRQVDKAQCAYLSALRLEPANGDTLLQLGHLLKVRGEPAQALLAYMRSREILGSSDAEDEFRALAEDPAVLVHLGAAARSPIAAHLLPIGTAQNDSLQKRLLPGELRLFRSTGDGIVKGVGDGIVDICSSAVSWVDFGAVLTPGRTPIKIAWHPLFPGRKVVYLLCATPSDANVSALQDGIDSNSTGKMGLRLIRGHAVWVRVEVQPDSQTNGVVSVEVRSTSGAQDVRVIVCALVSYDVEFVSLWPAFLDQLARGHFPMLREFISSARIGFEQCDIER